MNRIENDLKAALRRRPAPPGFVDRVLERIENDKHVENTPRRFLPGRSWILVAASLAVMAISAVTFEYQRYVNNRNQEALQHTLTALSIATVQLDRAESRAFEPIRLERLRRQLAGLENGEKK